MTSNCSFGGLWVLHPHKHKITISWLFSIHVQLQWILKCVWGPIQNQISASLWVRKAESNALFHSLEAPASAIWMNACLGTHTGGASLSQLAPCLKPPHGPFLLTVPVWKSSISAIALFFRAPHCWGSDHYSGQAGQSYSLQAECPWAKLSMEQRQEQLNSGVGSVTLHLLDESSGWGIFWSLYCPRNV